MPQPSRSPQEPKSEPEGILTVDPSSEIAGVQRKTYQTIGLEESDHMPISFEGKTYDLANLTADEVHFLLQYPEQVPYLKIVK